MGDIIKFKKKQTRDKQKIQPEGSSVPDKTCNVIVGYVSYPRPISSGFLLDLTQDEKTKEITVVIGIVE